MALACLATEAEHAGDRLARQGFALIVGSTTDLRQAVAAFDALRADGEGGLRIAPDHPLVTALLEQPSVRALVAEAVGPGARPAQAIAFDRQKPLPVLWHQCGPQPANAASDTAARRGLTLLWHLDLIGPADGALRVLPGSHAKGNLSAAEIKQTAAAAPAVELAVSAGTVLALRPLLVCGARRRATRGHRRILQVDIIDAPERRATDRTA